LLKLYPPSSGSVLLNTHDIADVREKEVRRHFGIVEQEPALFNGTVRENIFYNLDEGEVGEEKLRRAVELSGVDDLEQRMGEDGLEAKVGEGGKQLSLGEKQRISIARALLRDPSVILFDEPTSALDSKSKGMIKKTLIALGKEKRLIVIAHSEDLMEVADDIVVLKSGNLVAHGTFNELTAGNDQNFMELINSS